MTAVIETVYKRLLERAGGRWDVSVATAMDAACDKPTTEATFTNVENTSIVHSVFTFEQDVDEILDDLWDSFVSLTKVTPMAGTSEINFRMWYDSKYGLWNGSAAQTRTDNVEQITRAQARTELECMGALFIGYTGWLMSKGEEK